MVINGWLKSGLQRGERSTSKDWKESQKRAVEQPKQNVAWVDPGNFGLSEDGRMLLGLTQEILGRPKKPSGQVHLSKETLTQPNLGFAWAYFGSFKLVSLYLGEVCLEPNARVISRE